VPRRSRSAANIQPKIVRSLKAEGRGKGLRTPPHVFNELAQLPLPSPVEEKINFEAFALLKCFKFVN